MEKVSIIIPFVQVDEDTAQMTAECIESFRKTKGENDEIITVEDTEKKGNVWSWNEGIKRSTGDIILLSDNDVVAAEWRGPMVELLKKYEVVFPVVYNEKMGQEQRHLAGECFMFKRETYESIGQFDEEYGSYFEDTDWFMRVIREGGRLGVAEGAYVSHKSQGTFRKIWSPERIQENFEKNKALYESKYGASYPYLT